MSPRGVAIPDLREHLFDAAERVLAREGPGGLTSRAITREAGVAKGVLHNHFTDLDGFLAEFVIERFHLIATEAAKLPGLAGKGTVVGNLTDAVGSVFGAHAAAMLGLAMARPSVLPRLGHALSAGSPGLQEVEGSFAAYLSAEKELGRISPDADTDTLAVALIGTVHHLFMTHRVATADLRGGVRRVVEALIAGCTTGRAAALD
jgi:AcrR family transcriptional regulator